MVTVKQIGGTMGAINGLITVGQQVAEKTTASAYADHLMFQLAYDASPELNVFELVASSVWNFFSEIASSDAWQTSRMWRR